MSKKQGGFSTIGWMLIAIAGLLAFVLLSSTAPLNNLLFSKLYPKPASEAAPPQKSFSATLTLDPNPAECCGTFVSSTGSGYYPSADAYINILTPKSTYVYTRFTSSSGTLSFTFNTAEPGTYSVKVYQKKPKGGKLVQMSETPLDVVQLSP
ncbi:hypothetical protein HYT18_02260 [Candidatus Microgenomates bacterium]|nr:hypothetical protein [Candidatus Microgenomates bacterium]